MTVIVFNINLMLSVSSDHSHSVAYTSHYVDISAIMIEKGDIILPRK